jgi:hypothetical protein
MLKPGPIGQAIEQRATLNRVWHCSKDDRAEFGQQFHPLYERGITLGLPAFPKPTCQSRGRSSRGNGQRQRTRSHDRWQVQVPSARFRGVGHPQPTGQRIVNNLRIYHAGGASENQLHTLKLIHMISSLSAGDGGWPIRGNWGRIDNLHSNRVIFRLGFDHGHGSS